MGGGGQVVTFGEKMHKVASLPSLPDIKADTLVVGRKELCQNNCLYKIVLDIFFHPEQVYRVFIKYCVFSLK